MESAIHKEMQVLSVNISKEKGTIKKPVDEITIDDLGIIHDAHAGTWHRQVSLLGVESISQFEQTEGRKIQYGEFAENITTEGLDWSKVAPLDRLLVGTAELEITQIGKECHGTSCAIFKEVGHCIMPVEGVFARVIHHGRVRPGDYIEYRPKVYSVLVITLSDRASSGEYEDRSGPEVERVMEEYFSKQQHQSEIDRMVIPDDARKLHNILLGARDSKIDFIFTTGGTGIGLRDITTDVVLKVLDKEVSGIMDRIRFKYGQENPSAFLSRSVAGVMGLSLVFAIPGSVKAVKEYMTEITPFLQHMLYMLHRIDIH
jgi:molybdenum cofactor synthesis domain-containing protein